MNEHLQDLKAGGRSMKKWEIEMQQKDKEIKRLKEEYVMLQNASDEVEEQLQQRIDETLEYLDNSNMSFVDKNEIVIRLKGSDKE